MKENKKHRVAFIAIIATLAALFVLTIYGGYIFHWAWTGFNGADKTNKTLYDWLQLLIIPIVIAFVGLWFSQMQKSTEQSISNDNQKEEALQGYINEMSKLLLDKDLRKSKSEDEASIIGRVRTLTVLRRLDKFRKRAVIEFLYESGLIQKGKCIIKLKKASFHGAVFSLIDLHDADLRGALLFGSDLRRANLCGADLSEAILDFANLEKADLIGADLSNAILDFANLEKADLIGADLSNAILDFANLEKANLTDADLSNANLDSVYLKGAIVTNEQLEKAKLLTHATISMNPRIYNK